MDPVDAAPLDAAPLDAAPAGADPAGLDPATLLRSAADRLEALADRTTAGDWRASGLLASRPEVVAHRPDGSTEHVAEARAGSAGWILALSPAVAAPLAAVLRAAAEHTPVEPPARELAAVLLSRLPEQPLPVIDL
jgi:hypothetical protein